MISPLDESLEGKILAVPQKDEGPQYTKKGTLRKRRPKTKNQYFTQDTEDAILEYVNETDQDKRNVIYNERIKYAFFKLTENIIHTFKFYYTEVDTIQHLQHEVITFLLEKLHLYKQGKGKAFSYFGTIAKRYLILYNNNNYKKLKQKAGVDTIDNDPSIIRDLENSNPIQDYKDRASEFIEYLLQYFDLHLYNHFPKPEDAKTADAILELFRKRDNLELFNKKAIYIYIREITDQPTPQITKIIKKMKIIYKKLMTQYIESGIVSMKF
jgi:hypothetical protein